MDVDDQLVSKRKAARRLSWRRFYARHEAGHAVAAYALGLPVLSIVMPTATTSFGVPRTLPGRDAIERRVVALLAGMEALRYENGRRMPAFFWGADLDLTEVKRILRPVCRSAREYKAYYRLLEIRARDLLEAPDWSRAVKALAKVLLDRDKVDYHQCRVLIKQASGRNFGSGVVTCAPTPQRPETGAG